MWVETPSNPLLKIVDIAAVATIAHDAGARVVVDNTFATPALQRPLALGADAVVHSVTKYLGGHSDLIGGRDRHERPGVDRAARRSCTNAVGAVPGPMDCYLALRGLKTLAVRMARALRRRARRWRRSCASPSEGRGACTTRGSPSHPGHDDRGAADGGLRRHGVVPGRIGGARRSQVAERTELFFLAESLGGVESLIEVPGPDDPRERGGLAARGARRSRAAVGRASSTPTT